MSVIVRLQNLPWAANAVDIRQFFHGLSIPEGGVHIVGGELGDAFIAFSTDEDARQAMLRDGGKVKDIPIKLYLSSRAEMQKIIDQARQQSLGVQQFMAMPTMGPMSVPVTNIAVPNMPVQNVPMPNVQNVPSMQVPLQNVAAMVTNMAKQDTGSIARTPSTAVQDSTDNKSVISSNLSVKSDTDKDKKDKRRRRTRSHSRDSSNSRSESRSRSRSRSSSRSRDRKGRDRYHDRRRKRSRSRDRRRRRDRTRSRERSHRDRRKDYNKHGSKDEPDENNQSKWSNPAQRNRPGHKNEKQKSDLYNRDQQNQNRNQYQQRAAASKGGRNADSMRPPFSGEQQDNRNQTDTSNEQHQQPPPVLPLHQPNENRVLSQPPVPTVSTSSPALPISSSVPPVPQNALNPLNVPPNLQNMPPNNQNFYGNLPPPPMFNPQNLVSYPNYNPNLMPMFNNFPPPAHSMNPIPVQQDMNRKPEVNSKMDFGGNESRLSPSVSSPGMEHIPNSQNKHKMDTPQERKSKFGSDHPSSDIPLPTNEKMHKGSGGGPSSWGFGNSNYPSYGEDKQQSSNTTEPFGVKSNWKSVSNNNPNNQNDSNMFGKKFMNTCVQIKNVPHNITHKDIMAFFPNHNIRRECLKIVSDQQGQTSSIYVKFDSIADKKKAICRSGCLLNNSIVSVLHVDDQEFHNSVDVTSNNSPYWISGNEDMEKDNDMEDDNMIGGENYVLNCIKFQGNIRYHPFYFSKNKVHHHIKSLCDNFNVVDVSIVQKRGVNTIDGFIQFENSSVAESAAKFLSNAKVDGKQITFSICSNEEYMQAKNDSMNVDIQHFIRTSKGQADAFNKSNVKQEDRVDPRLQSTSYSEKRSELDDIDEDDLYDDDMEESKTDKEEPQFKKSNKVLLPTPIAMPPLQMDKSGPLITNCILLQNLPLQANDRDILDFFSSSGVVPTQIHIMLDSNGKQYGDAFCEFEKNEEAVTASARHGFLMGKNNVNVRLVSRQEMSGALGTPIAPMGLNPGGPGPLFNVPPMMFGNNSRMDFPRMGGNNEWMPFNQGPGPMGQGQNNNNFNSPGDHGFRQGGRGGMGRGDGEFRGRGSRGMGDRGNRGHGDFGGRGGWGGNEMGGRRGMGPNSNRGGRGGESNDRGNFNNRGRGGMDGMGRGGRGGMDMGRGRGNRGNMRGGPAHGGRDGNDFGRNQPPDLMSMPNIPPVNDQKQTGGPPSSITRPIQLEEDSVREFGQTGCVVSVENVPYRADLNDILDFFSDFNLTAENIIRRYNDAGQVTGDARVAFRTPAEAKKAIKYMNKKQIGNRKINLTLFK